MRNTIHHTNQKESIPINVSVKNNYGNVVASGNYTTAGTYNLSFTPASAGANYTLEFHMTKASAFCFFRVDDVLVSYDDTTTVTVCKEVEDGYRYGFQGQEKDDEIYGNGNSYTAEYWQYDSRLGRRWNQDPVVKPHRSPYDAFSNNPITRIDPDGADDFFNKKGKYLGSTKEGNSIRVIAGNEVFSDVVKDIQNKTKLLSEFDYTPDQVDNRDMLSCIGAYYAVFADIHDDIFIGESQTPTAAAFFNLIDRNFYIAVNDGKINKTINDINNLVNSFVHEKTHKDDESTHEPLNHVNSIITQAQHPSFEGTTEDFKEAQSSYAETLLNKALRGGVPLKDVHNKINEVNEALENTNSFIYFNEETGDVQKETIISDVKIIANPKK